LNLFQILKTIEDGAKVRCLTCEFEIIIALHHHHDMAAGDIFKCSRFSGTTFYATLKRLAEAGAVIVEVDPADKRSNRYGLSDELRHLIDHALRAVLT
jgi:DNA-binding MarR family transcriptional regulator